MSSYLLTAKGSRVLPELDLDILAWMISLYFSYNSWHIIQGIQHAMRVPALVATHAIVYRILQNQVFF